MGLLSEILAALPNEPKTYDVSDNPGYWTDGEEILCSCEAECEILADFFDGLFFDNDEIEVRTGYYDPEEDRRNNEQDDRTGFYYIAF